MTKDFAAELTDLLEEYGYKVTEALTESCKEVAQEAAKRVKAASPRAKKGERKYYKGWTSKVEGDRLTVNAVVYGKHGTYQLAHLLEHGHATRNGGRKAGAIEHIAPVERWAIEEVERRTVQKIEAIT